MELPEPIKDLQALPIVRRRQVWSPFMKKYNCRRICELGVFQGQNFGRLIEHNPEVAVGVDAWRNDGVISRCDSGFTQEQMDEMYQFVVKTFSDRPYVRLIRDYTFNAYKLFPDEYFDFIYIDADHTYEGVTQDLTLWYPKVKKGGFVIGDDYTNNRAPRTGLKFGVIPAVDDFFKKLNLTVYQLPKHAWGVLKP